MCWSDFFVGLVRPCRGGCSARSESRDRKQPSSAPTWNGSVWRHSELGITEDAQRETTVAISRPLLQLEAVARADLHVFGGPRLIRRGGDRLARSRVKDRLARVRPSRRVDDISARHVRVQPSPEPFFVALEQFHRLASRARTGSGLLVTVRAYETRDVTRPINAGVG